MNLQTLVSMHGLRMILRHAAARPAPEDEKACPDLSRTGYYVPSVVENVPAMRRRTRPMGCGSLYP